MRRRRPALAGSFRKAVVRYPHGTRLDRRPTPGGRLHRRLHHGPHEFTGLHGYPDSSSSRAHLFTEPEPLRVTSGSTRIPLDGPNTPERSSIRKTLHDEYDCPTARQPCMGGQRFRRFEAALGGMAHPDAETRADVADAEEDRFQVLYQANPCAEAARDLLRARAREWAASLDHDRLIAMRHGLEL
jgi:hypothetical protein